MRHTSQHHSTQDRDRQTTTEKSVSTDATRQTSTKSPYFPLLSLSGGSGTQTCHHWLHWHAHSLQCLLLTVCDKCVCTKHIRVVVASGNVVRGHTFHMKRVAKHTHNTWLTVIPCLFVLRLSLKFGRLCYWCNTFVLFLSLVLTNVHVLYLFLFILFFALIFNSSVPIGSPPHHPDIYAKVEDFF